MMPRVIRTLLLINVIVFVVDYVTHGAYFFSWMALDPLLVTHGHHQYWRLFTYMFVHDYTSLMHILFNMLTLWMFGTPVAHEMGEGRFWRFYLFSGVFAGLCSLIFYAVTGNPAVVIGASGAIFAVMFAFARFFPNSQILLLFLFPVSAKYAVLILGAIELLLITSNDHIAHIAHLGGALFAWAYLHWDDRGGLGWWDGVTRWRERRRDDKRRREAAALQEAMEDIDPILEKISRTGIQSLTREEKEKLDRVSALKRRQRGDNTLSFEDYRSRR